MTALADALAGALARRNHLDAIARAGDAVPAQLAAEVERDIRTAEAALVRSDRSPEAHVLACARARLWMLEYAAAVTRQIEPPAAVLAEMAAEIEQARHQVAAAHAACRS